MRKLPLVLASFWRYRHGSVVGYSYLQLGRMQPVVDENTGDVNPPPLSGLATAWQRVYAANGCVSCHTQQVRSAHFRPT
jgi:cbb3-type cytochrome oxidase cytochrome c subunit